MGRCLPLATRAWEPQRRGPGHVYPVFHVYSPGDVEVARCYLRHVARLGRKHGFGFVGEKRGASMQLMSGDRAAAYLSSYFVRGKGSEATLQENALKPAPAANADLGLAEADAADRGHDAKPSSLPPAVGCGRGCFRRHRGRPPSSRRSSRWQARGRLAAPDRMRRAGHPRGWPPTRPVR
jgi:hypothetical protein